MDKWQIRFFCLNFGWVALLNHSLFILEQLSGVFLGRDFTDTDVILKADKPKIGNKTVKNPFRWSAHPSRHFKWPPFAFGTAFWTFLEHDVCREEGGADPRLLQEIILLACDIWLEQSHAGSSWPASRRATQPLWRRETASCLQQPAYAC